MYLIRVSSLRNLSNCLSRVFSMKDERLMEQYDFAGLGFVPGLGVRTTLTSLHGFGIWPITIEHLFSLIKYLIIRSNPICRQTG